MTVLLTGSWQPIVPVAGVRSALVQNPTGNSNAFVTQRLGASGTVEASGADCTGVTVAAAATLSLEASSTIWVKGTNTNVLTIVFFR